MKKQSPLNSTFSPGSQQIPKPGITHVGERTLANSALSFVLIVGDFEEKPKQPKSGASLEKQHGFRGSFGWDAWLDIKAEFLRLLRQRFPDAQRDLSDWHQLDPTSPQREQPEKVLERVMDLVNGLQIKQHKEINTRAPLPPIPIPLNDRAPWRDAPLELRNLLRRYLRQLDIVAIVSCSPALHAKTLLDALRPLEVPVLVTVSSVISLLDNLEEEHRPVPQPLPNVLRLIPSNELQGQAIIERVLGKRTKSDTKTPDAAPPSRELELVIFAPDRLSNVYVHDVVRELKQRASERTPPLQLNILTSYEELRAQPPHIVSIGYRDTLERLIGELKKHGVLDSLKNKNNDPLTIVQTDGCTEEEVQELISRNVIPTGLKIFLARPARLHREYARHAYDSVAKAWEAYIRPPSRLWNEVTLSERLFPFVGLVRRYLQHTLPDAYHFLANENQRGGFLIEKVNANDTPRA